RPGQFKLLAAGHRKRLNFAEAHADWLCESGRRWTPDAKPGAGLVRPDNIRAVIGAPSENRGRSRPPGSDAIYLGFAIWDGRKRPGERWVERRFVIRDSGDEDVVGRSRDRRFRRSAARRNGVVRVRLIATVNGVERVMHRHVGHRDVARGHRAGLTRSL